MRSLLSIFLSEDKKKEIEKRAKKAKVNLEKQLISETELIKMSKNAEKDYKSGKAKKLKSLADLV